MSDERKGPRNNRFITRQSEYIDHDYIDKLSPDEKAWLDKFDGEYYGSNFFGKESLHPEEMKKDVYNSTNASRRDLLTTKKLGGDVVSLDDSIEVFQIEDGSESYDELLKTQSVKSLFNKLVAQAKDDMLVFGESADDVLKRFAFESRSLLNAEVSFQAKERKRIWKEKRKLEGV